MVLEKENKMKTVLKATLRHSLAILIVLSMLLAASPQTAQAATCDTYYRIKSGDTKSSIAELFDLKWSEIADANDLRSGYIPKVGQRLCIPESNNNEDNPNVKLSATSTHTLLTLKITGLSDKKAVFVIRTRDSRVGVNGWYMLGRMKAKKNTTNKDVFAIPTQLLKTTYLQVCAKNQTTNEMVCRTVIHP